MKLVQYNISQIARFMGPTWGPPGSFRPQMGPMLAPWTLLSWMFSRHCGNLVLAESCVFCCLRINSLRPRQNRRHFANDVFKCNFLNENVWIPIKNSLKFVPKCPINNLPALIQIMARGQTGDKPISEPMMTQYNDAYMCHSTSMS